MIVKVGSIITHFGKLNLIEISNFSFGQERKNNGKKNFEGFPNWNR